MTKTTDLATVNDGAVIQDFNVRNAVTGLKNTITNLAAAGVVSVTASTTTGGIAAALDDLQNKLRLVGLVV